MSSLCAVIHDRNVLYSLHIVQSMFVDRLSKVQGPTEAHGQRPRALVHLLIVAIYLSRNLQSIRGYSTSTHRLHTEPFRQRSSDA